MLQGRLANPEGGEELNVSFSFRAAKHIVDDHVHNREEKRCWDRWIGSLGESVDLERLAGMILETTKESFERPLVLAFFAGLSRRSVHCPVRLAILRNGALAVIRWNGFATCFFPCEAVDFPHVDLRFQQVARRQVQRYAQPTDSKKDEYKLPRRQFGVWIKEEQEYRTRIRFLTPTSWGFENKDGMSEQRHFGRIPPWKTSPSPAAQSRWLVPFAAKTTN
jgi:hypothetical protein